MTGIFAILNFFAVIFGVVTGFWAILTAIAWCALRARAFRTRRQAIPQFENAFANALTSDLDLWDSPTLSSTSHAVRLQQQLRELDDVGEKLGANPNASKATMEFVAHCYVEGAANFSLSSTAASTPSLYATRSALRILKDLKGISEEKALTRRVATEFFRSYCNSQNMDGEEIIERIAQQARERLSSAFSGDTESTVFDLHTATWIISNLEGWTPNKGREVWKATTQYVRYLDTIYDNNADQPAFCMYPRGTPGFKRSLSASVFALNNVQLLDWSATVGYLGYAAREALRPCKKRFVEVHPFLLRCWSKTSGGFADHPGLPGNIQSTWAAIDYAERTGLDIASNIDSFVSRLASFVENCYGSGAYAFYPGERPNCWATQCVLQIDELARRKYKTRVLTSAKRLQEIHEFLEEVRFGPGTYTECSRAPPPMGQKAEYRS